MNNFLSFLSSFLRLLSLLKFTCNICSKSGVSNRFFTYHLSLPSPTLHIYKQYSYLARYVPVCRELRIFATILVRVPKVENHCSNNPHFLQNQNTIMGRGINNKNHRLKSTILWWTSERWDTFTSKHDSWRD